MELNISIIPSQYKTKMQLQIILLENFNRSLDNYNSWILPEFIYYKWFIGLITETVEKYIARTFYKEYFSYWYLESIQIIHKLNCYT